MKRSSRMNKRLIYITILFIAISIMSCASTKNKAYKELRKHYINTAELDTIMGMDQLPIQYLEFEKTFPKAYQILKDYLNDNTVESRQVFYEDDEVRKSAHIAGENTRTGLYGIYIHIYNKKFNITEKICYEEDGFKVSWFKLGTNSSAIGYRFMAVNNGGKKRIAITNRNHIKSYEEQRPSDPIVFRGYDIKQLLKEEKKIKKKYPITALEAYELAKFYHGKPLKAITEHDVYSSTTDKNTWSVCFYGESKEYVDYYKVKAKNGKIKYRRGYSMP